MKDKSDELPINQRRIVINMERETISLSAGQNQLSTQAANRIEVLTVLSQTILRELDAFRMEGIAQNSASIDLPKEVQNFEIDLIRCALLRTGGRQRQAARLLNLKTTTLNAKIKKYGINPIGLLPR